jgi:hypothetical protein
MKALTKVRAKMPVGVPDAKSKTNFTQSKTTFPHNLI